MANRVTIVMEEVYDIVNRIGNGTRLETISEYEKIMEIRKGLFLIENKLVKQEETMVNHEKLSNEV